MQQVPQRKPGVVNANNNTQHSDMLHYDPDTEETVPCLNQETTVVPLVERELPSDTHYVDISGHPRRYETARGSLPTTADVNIQQFNYLVPPPDHPPPPLPATPPSRKPPRMHSTVTVDRFGITSGENLHEWTADDEFQRDEVGLVTSDFAQMTFEETGENIQQFPHPPSYTNHGIEKQPQTRTERLYVESFQDNDREDSHSTEMKREPPYLAEPHCDYMHDGIQDGEDENWFRCEIPHNPANNFPRHKRKNLKPKYDNNREGEFEVEDNDNVEDLEGIPAYNEIPYALLLCNVIDHETLAKAKKKQYQMNIMKFIQQNPHRYQSVNFHDSTMPPGGRGLSGSTHNYEEEGERQKKPVKRELSPDSFFRKDTATLSNPSGLPPSRQVSLWNSFESRERHSFDDKENNSNASYRKESFDNQRPHDNQTEVHICSRPKQESTTRGQDSRGPSQNYTLDNREGSEKTRNLAQRSPKATTFSQNNNKVFERNVNTSFGTKSRTNKNQGVASSSITTHFSTSKDKNNSASPPDKRSEEMKKRFNPKSVLTRSMSHDSDYRNQTDRRIDNRDIPINTHGRSISVKMNKKTAKVAYDSRKNEHIEPRDAFEPTAMKFFRENKKSNADAASQKKSVTVQERMNQTKRSDTDSDEVNTKPASTLNINRQNMKTQTDPKCTKTHFKKEQGYSSNLNASQESNDVTGNYIQPKLRIGGNDRCADTRNQSEQSREVSTNLGEAPVESVDHPADTWNDREAMAMFEELYTERDGARSVNDINDFSRRQFEEFQQLLKPSRNESLKCSRCGRSECQSGEIVQMKQFISCAHSCGFDVVDINPDGNCMFAAVVHQLQITGNNVYTSKTLREASVAWLVEHPSCEDVQTHGAYIVADEWPTYLQKMMTEGVSGDHVALRAVVNVTGHSVCLLTLRNNDAIWTSISPDNTSRPTDMPDLTIGQIGETHYTSLTPRVVSATMSRDSVEEQESDDTDKHADYNSGVCMFRDDYVDPWSTIPSLHLSFLLCHVAPPRVIIQMAFNTGNSMRHHYQQKCHKSQKSDGEHGEDVFCYGSWAEGTHYGPFAMVSEDRETTQKWLDICVAHISTRVRGVRIEQHAPNDFLMIETGHHAGYLHLYQYKMKDSCLKIKYYQSMHMRQMSKEQSCKPCCGCQNQLFKQDTFCLACEWPESGGEWVARARYQCWPHGDIIATAVQDGCLLEPESHPSSVAPENEWNYSFCLLEMKLFKEVVSPEQKYCYMIFQFICIGQFLNTKMFNPKVLKNTFLFACERVPVEYWETKPGSCLIYLIDDLMVAFNRGVLMNYFLPTNNMIDHLTEAQRLTILSQLITIRRNMDQIIYHLNKLFHFLDSDPIVDNVLRDCKTFALVKNIRNTKINVFGPALVAFARRHVKRNQFQLALYLINKAYQERLMVHTCDDSLTFENFIQDSVRGIDITHNVWFCNLADSQFGNQLSRPLIQSTFAELGLVRLADVIRPDLVNSIPDAEIPEYFARRLDELCRNFALFLIDYGDRDSALAVLVYCHDEYVRSNDGYSTQTDRFTPDTMYNVYLELYNLFKMRNKPNAFRDYLPYMDNIVRNVNNPQAHKWVSDIHKELGDNHS